MMVRRLNLIITLGPSCAPVLAYETAASEIEFAQIKSPLPIAITKNRLEMKEEYGYKN